MDSSQNIRAYFNETHLHPLAAVMLVVLGLAMLALPRRHALMPMILMACLVSQAQRVAIFTLNFDLLRILMLIGWARVAMRREWRGFRPCRTDWWFVAWVAYGFLTALLLSGTPEALKNRLGFSYEALGMYFLFRVLIRTWDDVHHLAIEFATVAIPVSLTFLVERATSRNLFAIFGGVPELTGVRDGRLRCQGAFSHAILAGCFWASLMPLMAVQWWRGGVARWRGLVGVVAACIIVVTCASSTPITAVAVGILGAALFPVRKHARLIRWALVLTLVALHLSMDAPVWHLVSRLDLVGGSTGWHRFHLIDAFVSHFSEWCMIGRAELMEGWGQGLYDVTNDYIMQGLEGGVLLLALFIAIIGSSFASVGRMTRAAGNTDQARFAWALGVSLLIHAVNFLAVTYFGQIVMLWYLALATIASMSVSPATSPRRRLVYVQTHQPPRFSNEPALNRSHLSPLPQGAA